MIILISISNSNNAELPLFSWASRQQNKSLPIAGRRLCHAGYIHTTARTICELAAMRGGI